MTSYSIMQYDEHLVSNIEKEIKELTIMFYILKRKQNFESAKVILDKILKDSINWHLKGYAYFIDNFMFEYCVCGAKLDYDYRTRGAMRLYCPECKGITKWNQLTIAYYTQHISPIYVDFCMNNALSMVRKYNYECSRNK